MNRFIVFLLQILLWFYRLGGVTFGGLAIDSKGNLSVNKCLKYFGYACNVVVIMLEVFHYVWAIFFGEHDHDHEKEIMKEIPENMRTLTYLVFHINSFLFDLLKVSTLIFFNKHGYQMIKMMLENTHHKSNARVTNGIVFVVFFWLIGIIAYATISTLSVMRMSNFNWEKIFKLSEYHMSFIYFSTLMALIWIISIKYSRRLEELATKLEISAARKSSCKFGPCNANAFCTTYRGV